MNPIFIKIIRRGNMNGFQIMSLIVAVIGGVGMNIAMKYSSHLQPFNVYAISYLVAAGICFALTMMYAHSFAQWSLNSRLVVSALGVSFVILNLGFLRLYSSGLSVAYIPLAVTGGQTLLLTLLAVGVFKETLTWQMVVGIVLIFAGLFIMSFKSS